MYIYVCVHELFEIGLYVSNGMCRSLDSGFPAS